MNKATGSNMDGPRDCPIKGSKWDKYNMIPLTCGIQKKKLYKQTYLTNRLTDTGNKTYGYQRGGQREDK